MRKIGLIFVLLLLTSCGSYRFVGQANSLPGGIKQIYIDNVINETTEPNLQVYLKDDLINVFNLDRRVTVVGLKSEADGFLKIKIVNYSVDPISYNANGLAYRYRCTIQAKIKLLKPDGESLAETTITSYQDYNAKDEVSATEEARGKISKDVLKDLALKIRNALFVNF